MDKSMDEFRKGYADQAKDIVKSQLVIDKLIEKQEIVATDEDVEARVEEMAKAQGNRRASYLGGMSNILRLMGLSQR